MSNRQDAGEGEEPAKAPRTPRQIAFVSFVPSCEYLPFLLGELGVVAVQSFAVQRS